jgi:GT2 family glycosyltransferase
VYVPNVNEGYPGGNVTGVRYAKGDYVMITNPDTTLEKGAIERLVRDFLHRPDDVMVLVPKIMIRQSNVLNSIGMKRIRPMENIYTNIGYLERDAGQFDAPRKVEAFDGSAFMFRRQLLRHTHLFDPRFFFGSDATDLAERINKLGFGIWTCPRAVVRHEMRGSVGSTNVNEQLVVLIVRNALIHTLKNMGWGMFLQTIVVGMLYRNIFARFVTRQHPRLAILYLRGVAKFFFDLGLFLRF